MLKIKSNHNSYKIGLEEIEGLGHTLRLACAPILKALKSKMYWTDSLDFESAEYKSRDGFSAHSHNCGGLMFSTVIPKCEEYEFGFLEFGECAHEDCEDYEDSGECYSESDGHLDAALRLFIKFEGLNEDGSGSFYINLSGGNGDAPYFRSQHLTDVYEYEFTAQNLDDLYKKLQKPIQDLINLINKA